MYISAEGAQAQVRRMEVISNNLANVNTPGFKPSHATFQARFAEAVEQGLAPAGSGQEEDIGGGVMMVGTPTDYSSGAINVTGQKTDMAIDGEGFFQVRKGNDTYLTRAGNFKIDSAGQLMTQSGYPVLDTSGTPITISSSDWQLSAEGGIVQAGEGEAKLLALMKPNSLGDLVPSGDNLFRSLASVDSIEPAARRVLGGHLEMSGVNPTTAMMELIETSRAIEANMKLIQNQDHMLSQLIGRVLQS